MLNMRNMFILLVTLLVIVICVLPILSVDISDGGSYKLIVRGYNLMEFSAWGCVPIIAPALIPVIVFGHQAKAAKELELMILFSAHIVCFVHSFNLARAWLYDIGGAPVYHHYGMILYSMGFIILLFLLIILAKQEGDNVYEV